MNEKKNVLVLGAGMMGRAIALDLVQQHNVWVLDNDIDRLALFHDSAVMTVHSDVQLVSDYMWHIQNADVVIGAMPGAIAFDVLKKLVKLGKKIVDISFFEEDPFELHALAEEHGAILIVDMGVAPGMSNAILGYENSHMRVESFTCYVGGLPVSRDSITDYKAPFAPASVVDEYTRTARVVEHGQIVEKEALSEPESVYIQDVGDFVAVNTDGLRTLMATMNVPCMYEKTLRYKRHIDLMHTLQKIGFFSDEKIEVSAGVSVSPLKVTTKLLCDAWRMEEGEEEFTVMLIEIKGREPTTHNISDGLITVQYLLVDRGDKLTKTSSMARATGYACTAAVELFLSGGIKGRGLITPEQLGAQKGFLKFLIEYMAERGVVYKRTEPPAVMKLKQED